MEKTNVILVLTVFCCAMIRDTCACHEVMKNINVSLSKLTILIGKIATSKFQKIPDGVFLGLPNSQENHKIEGMLTNGSKIICLVDNTVCSF